MGEVEIVEDEEEQESAEQKFFSSSGHSTPENYLDFIGRVAEPSDPYRKKFDELQRDLVLANLRTTDEERLTNLQTLIRDIFWIEDNMRRSGRKTGNIQVAKDRYLSRFATLIEMTRARRGKTLDTLITQKNISLIKQEAAQEKKQFWDRLAAGKLR